MKYKKILLLNLIPNTIGDNILLTPLINILKKEYPETKIDITASALNSELFENNPNLNDIIKIDELKHIAKRGAKKILKLITYVKLIEKYSKFLKKKKYDLCFVLLPNFPLNVLIPKLAGIKEIIGYTYKGSIFSFLLDKKTQYRGLFETKDYTRHFVESYLDLLNLLDIKWKEEQVFSELFLLKKEIVAVKEILKKHKLKPQKYICFQAGSKDNGWSIFKFQKLAKQIQDNSDYKIVLLGAKKEFNKNNIIKNKSKKVVNLCGKKTLRETMAIFKLARLSICNDSGLAHMSSSLGTETIVLFGPHSPLHSQPIGKGKVHIIYEYYKEFPYVQRGSKEGIERINKIKVKDVYKEVKKMLK